MVTKLDRFVSLDRWGQTKTPPLPVQPIEGPTEAGFEQCGYRFGATTSEAVLSMVSEITGELQTVGSATS